MIKKEIVQEISKKTGVPPKVVELVVDAFLFSIKKNVLKYKTIFLRGFGRFFLKKYPKKKVRNIYKGKAMILPERYEFFYSPAGKLKAKARRVPIIEQEIDTKEIINFDEDDEDLSSLDPSSTDFGPKPTPDNL